LLPGGHYSEVIVGSDLSEFIKRTPNLFVESVNLFLTKALMKQIDQEKHEIEIILLSDFYMKMST
jgi:hypothetical protein